MSLRVRAVAALFFLPLLALSQNSSRTVVGEVTDVACHTKSTKAGDREGGIRDSHAECALLCVRKGMPAGIVAIDGVYWITGTYARNDNKALLPFVNKRVRATGAVSTRDGRLTLELKTIEEVKP